MELLTDWQIRIALSTLPGTKVGTELRTPMAEIYLPQIRTYCTLELICLACAIQIGEREMDSCQIGVR